MAGNLLTKHKDRSPHHRRLIRVGAEFKNGKLVERPDESAGEIGGDQQVA